MKSLQTLFVCEFITGGGVAACTLTQSLVHEGLLMRDALLTDLMLVDGWRLTTTHDSRLAPPPIASVAIDSDCDVWEIWQQCMLSADAVWIVAPETDGILQRMAEMAESAQVRWIGPDLDAIKVASDKYWMAQRLSLAGLPVIPTCFYADWQAGSCESWVVKPNDGAGCSDSYVFNQGHALERWFAEDIQRQQTHIIQPYVTGTAASLCVLATEQQTHVLSCNLQRVDVQDGVLQYRGGIINGAREYWAQLSLLVDDVKAAMPGLKGYFGIDILLNSPDIGGVTIVEINPRLTTSYIHLQQAMGCNPAALILQAMLSPAFTMPQIQQQQITFYV